MNCARLRLQERLKPRPRGNKREGDGERCRRYCQKRMVDPTHEEDPRWTDGIMERFRCKPVVDDMEPTTTYDSSERVHPYPENTEDLFLTVQTLKFQGDSQERKRPRTAFKYKAIRDGNKHRMFVKQVVEYQDEREQSSSQENQYYFEDYVKYILSPDRSRPSTGCSNYRTDASKDKDIETDQKSRASKDKKCESKFKAHKKQVKIDDAELTKKDTNLSTKMDDTKISYHKTGKRKSLTISRTQSPETVQVIRVDVVCNYSSADSNISDCDDKKQTIPQSLHDDKKNNSPIDLRNTQFANKYLLTKTVKSLDANVAGGSKVTLLCKTFRLTDRTKNSGEAANQRGKGCFFRR